MQSRLLDVCAVRAGFGFRHGRANCEVPRHRGCTHAAVATLTKFCCTEFNWLSCATRGNAAAVVNMLERYNAATDKAHSLAVVNVTQVP